MSTTAVVTGPQRAAMARLAAEFIQADPTFNTFMNFDIDLVDDRTLLFLAIWTVTEEL